MVQQHKQGKRQDDEAEVDTQSGGAETKPGLDEDVDSILDEIDDVLEENAEDFVRSYIQKGGE